MGVCGSGSGEIVAGTSGRLQDVRLFFAKIVSTFANENLPGGIRVLALENWNV